MQRYTLYAWPTYDAMPWPFDDWPNWRANGCPPDDAPHAANALARQSLLDGMQESSVPAYLPRPAAKGDYRAAVYHDNDAVYFVLWAKPGKPVSAGENADVYFAVAMIASADENDLFQFTFSNDGAQPGTRSTNMFGPRQPENKVSESDIHWQGSHTSHPGGWQCFAWRIARSSIADGIFGQTMRIGISYMHVGSIECATWGTNHAWRGRTDQLIDIRLVDKPTQPDWPIVRRIDLDYDPAAETGSLVVEWDNPFAPGESFTGLDLPPRRTMHWDQFAARIGRHTSLTKMGSRSTTEAMKFEDGVQQIEISAATSPPISLAVEKRSGNRLVAPHLQQHPVDKAELRAAIEASADDEPPVNRDGKGKVHPTDAGRGPAIARTWRGVTATALARMAYYFNVENHGRELLRKMADDAITLQRDDGTYAGWHLSTEPGGTSDVRWKGGAYDAGCVGEMWIAAYKLLGDEKYLTASQRLIEAYKTYRFEFNNNFASFGLWHIATHYRLTGDELALEHGRYYAKHIAAVDLLPCGFQSGHNYYTVYGSITLRGIALLAMALPEGDPQKAELTERATRMANAVFARTGDDGWIDSRDRCYVDFGMRIFAPLLIGFLKPGEETIDLLDRYLAAQLRVDNPSHKWAPPERVASNDLVHYWAFRDRLKAGEAIDLKEMI